MKSIILLSTDTDHHRYFINRIAAASLTLNGVIFERESVKPPFITGPLFEADQERFECEIWQGWLDLDETNVTWCDEIGSPESLELIERYKPDLGVVFGTRRLSDDVIARFPDGLINVHRGIATRYRGLDSDLWAIYHADWGNIGTTIHAVDSDLDTGAIIEQKPLRLTADMRCHHLRLHTSELATDMVIRALNQYLDGSLHPVPQTAFGRYYSFMPLDLKKLAQRRFDRHCETRIK